MSIGGDDDIDDLIRELRRTNQRLDQLVEAIMRGTEQQESEETNQVDLWNVGESSATVETVDEYIQERSRAANSPNITAPGTKGVDDLVDFFTEVYTRAGDNLQRILWALGVDLFNGFVRGVAKDYGANDRLVDMLNPTSSFFGIEVVNREVRMRYAQTHMNFTLVSGDNYYYPPEEETVGDVRPVNPIDTLRLQRIEQDLDNFRVVRVGAPGQPPLNDTDNFIVFGGLSPVEVNRSLARSIDERGGLTLPEEFRDLL